MHAQIFCIYMLVIAFAYFLYLYADIRYHKYRAKHQKRMDHNQRTQNVDEFIKGECADIDSGNQVLFTFFCNIT